MTPFYVLGLPRSRTLWFSQFLSYGGVKCVHEHFTADRDAQHIDGIRGYIDTNPLLARDYGDSPVLIIERDVESVIDSIYNAFDKPRGVKHFRYAIRKYMAEYKKALDSLKPKNCLRIKYNEINHRILEIWHFLMPDIRPTYEHFNKYLKKVIKTPNRDIEKSLIHTFGSIEKFAQQYDRPTLKTERISDYAVVAYIMNKVWDEISEDDAPPYIPDLINEYWIVLIEGNKTVGCFRCHQINGITWEGHIFILPEYRKDYSEKAGYAIYEWLLENLEFQKLIVKIPQKYQNVIKFIEKFGFTHEGTNRLSYRKDGKIWNMEHYGITVDEIKDYMQWPQQQQ